MIAADTALLIVDVQVGLDDERYGPRNNPGAESRMAELLACWRERGWPVVHVQHLSRRPESPLAPGRPGAAIKSEVRPIDGEPVVRKSVNTAFIGTGLERLLRERAIRSLVVVGLTTDHCVSATARTAGDLGFATYVVADATACHGKRSFDGTWFEPQLVHDTALASLHGEFAEVLTVEELMSRL